MKNFLKKCSAVFLICVISFSVFAPGQTTVQAVTPSKSEYTLLMDGPRFYIHNKKTLGAAEGTEYYMTYTVKKAVKTPGQQGVIGTADYTRNFPYTEGGLMRYNGSGQNLMEQGYTYFYKFVVASGGFTYNISRAKGDVIEDIILEKTADTGTGPMKYFGVWLAYDYVEAEFGDVRFYDKNGNDLGVKLEYPVGTGIVLSGSGGLSKTTSINHRYDVTIKDKHNIAISNLRAASGDRIYMEYTVESAEYLLNQNGFALSNDPESDYPHRNAGLKYTNYKTLVDSVNLLEPGASYVVMVDKGEKAFNVLVKKTKDGSSERFIMKEQFGKYDKSFAFASLWFGAGQDTNATFKLTDVKFYDYRHVSLGVQANVAADIVHHGEMEDYSACAGVYYCDATGDMMVLRDDCTMDFVRGDSSSAAKYSIADNVMTASYKDSSSEYNYLFRRITDGSGNIYRRLYYYFIDFVTGTDTKTPRQEYSLDTGYYSTEPAAPVKAGDKFLGWYDSDGVKYCFGNVVTKSEVLYAKWENGGISYTHIDSTAEESSPAGTTSFLIYGIGGALVLAGLALGIVFIRKGAKGEKA